MILDFSYRVKWGKDVPLSNLEKEVVVGVIRPCVELKSCTVTHFNLIRRNDHDYDMYLEGDWAGGTVMRRTKMFIGSLPECMARGTEWLNRMKESLEIEGEDL